MIKHALRFAVLALVALGSAPASAITVSETTDFDNSASFAWYASSVGLLDPGVNTISGSLDGNCLDTAYGLSCNPGTLEGGDTQDSFQLEVGSGYAINSLTVTTSNVSGPAGFSASFNLRDSSYAVLASDYSLPLDSTTPDLIVSAIGAGLYSISMFGQTASEIGAYSLDYSIEINVSAVPVPAAAWLFGSGLLGLVSIARRRRSA